MSAGGGAEPAAGGMSDAERALAADSEALQALRQEHGQRYRIGYDAGRGWWAARRDGQGGEITAKTPAGLRAAVDADCALNPVPPGQPGWVKPDGTPS